MTNENVDLSLSQRVQALAQAYESLSVQGLIDLAKFYAPQAIFQDPFNDVKGWQRIELIFLHMFETLRSPRFVIDEQVTQGQSTFLTWRFFFWHDAMSTKEEQCIRGATHLMWEKDAIRGWEIALHKDYWDAAQELYERLPVIGALMRWLKSKLST